MENKKLLPMPSDEVIFFEAAQNAAGGFFGEPCHIGQVLVGKPNGNADAAAFLNARTLRKVHKEGSYALLGPVQGKSFGIVL